MTASPSPSPGDLPDSLFGFFSPKACDMNGSGIWLSPSGKKVEVTYVTESARKAEEIKEEYRWPDAVPVGPVARYLCPGMDGACCERSFLGRD